MSKGYLSETDCNRIYWMCKRLDNYFVMIAYMEEVVRRYPENEEFTGRLAREYAQSSENRDKAIFTVNKNVGVKKQNDKYIVEKKRVTHNVLASFFDVYVAVDKYAEILAIADLLLEAYPMHSDMIRRNIVTAYNGLAEYSKAEAAAKALVESNPVALNRYALYRVYRASDRYYDAYEQIEKCIATEPNDVDYLIFAAGLILDSGYIRTKNGYDSSITRVTKQQAIAAAVPFVFEAFANNCAPSRCIDFLRKNNINDAAAILESCSKQGITQVPRKDTYNYFPLEYCIQKNN